MLSVRELLRELDVELLAGDDAAEAPVRWVHISELADPTPWLSGGELLLCTGMTLADPEAQRAFVTRLADHGLAGLGFGVGFGHDRTPEALVQAARERDFPLFEVPYDVPFIAITEKAFATLVNEGYAALRRSIAAQERLQRIVLSERGLDAVAGALATLIGGAALVFDGRGEPLAQRRFRRDLDESAVAALSATLRERARAGAGEAFGPEHPELAGRSLALPVAAAGEPRAATEAVPQAWLVAVKDNGGLAEFDRLLLHQAVTVVALELLRRRVAGTTEKRLAGDVLTQLVSGALAGDELVRRLAPFGLGDRVAALAIAARGDRGERAEEALEVALRDEAVDGLVARTGDLACALMPGYADEELFELAERVRVRVAEMLAPDAAVRAAVGRAVATGAARRSFHEARCALEARAMAGTAPPGPPRTNGNGDASSGSAPAGVATYRDLGSFQLLLSLQGTDALRLYCDSLLGPLEEGESPYGGELVRSLEAFIECNGQWEAAARRLYCHRHTLRYRIRRIEELTGRDLGSARDRIEFWLALRGRELAA
jgi:purine catabolism regulator